MSTYMSSQIALGICISMVSNIEILSGNFGENRARFSSSIRPFINDPQNVKKYMFHFV